MKPPIRYASPSKKRLRRRIIIIAVVVAIAVVLFIVPIIGKKLNLPYELNIINYVKSFTQPLYATQNSPSPGSMPSTATAAPKSSPTPEEIPDVIPAVATDIRQQYAIEISMRRSLSQLDCIEQIVFTNPSGQALEQIVLRVFQNSTASSAGQAPASLSFSRVVVNGRNTSYELGDPDNSSLILTLPEPLGAGESARLTLAFSLPFNGDSDTLGQDEQTVRLSYFYPVIAQYNEDGWNLNQPSASLSPWYQAKSDYTINLLVPSDYAVASSGTAELQEEGTGQWQIKAENVRDFTLALGYDMRKMETTVGGATLNAYAKLTSHAQRMIDIGGQALSHFGNIVGPYSGELDVFESKLSGYTATHSGLIFIDMGSYWENDEMYYQLALAIARLWFGIDVYGDADAVKLNELLSHYLAASFVIDIQGEGSADAAFAHCAEARELADLRQNAGGERFDAAMQSYRLNAAGRAATAELFSDQLPEQAAQELHALLDRFTLSG